MKCRSRRCNLARERADWAASRNTIVFGGTIMQLHAGLLAAAAFAALLGPARAADGDQFVIRGDATKTILEQDEINVATAEAVGKACIDEAQKQGVKVSVAVYDQFGEMVYLYRMDGQPKIAVETAMMKARTVLNTLRPSKSTMNDVLRGRSAEIRQVSRGNFPQGGGLPILVGNQLIGVIGVGGSAGNLPVWSDEICAWRALTKVIGPQPALLPDIQGNARPTGGTGGAPKP
jgi:glc operon protein GlcG